MKDLLKEPLEAQLEGATVWYYRHPAAGACPDGSLGCCDTREEAMAVIQALALNSLE